MNIEITSYYEDAASRNTQSITIGLSEEDGAEIFRNTWDSFELDTKFSLMTGYAGINIAKWAMKNGFIARSAAEAIIEDHSLQMKEAVHGSD